MQISIRILSSLLALQFTQTIPTTGKLFLIFGAPGVGKTTFINRALQEHAKILKLSELIPYTTRAPRAFEKDGKDYYFVSKEKFEELKTKKIIATDLIFEYRNNFYAPPQTLYTLLEQGTSCLLVSDYRRLEEMRKKMPDAITILITVKDRETVKERLKSRGTDAVELEDRLKYYDYVMAEEKKKSPCSYTIFNEDLEKSFDEFVAVLKKESSKTQHNH